MTRTIINMDPATELRRMSEVFDRLWGWNQPAERTTSLTLPLDIYEQNGMFTIKAAVPGVRPDEVDISIEDNVLTIRGEHKHEQETEDTKVYRREYSYGSFTRSVRLPEDLQVDQVSAEFRDGFVYVTMPKVEAPKPKTLKVPVKSATPLESGNN